MKPKHKNYYSNPVFCADISEIDRDEEQRMLNSLLELRRTSSDTHLDAW